MEKRLHGLHYGRASLGIKKALTPPHTGTFHCNICVRSLIFIGYLMSGTPPSHSSYCDNHDTPQERKERDRQSSPARMETPMFLPNKTREVKQTPHTSKPLANGHIRTLAKTPAPNPKPTAGHNRSAATTAAKPAPVRNKILGISTDVKGTVKKTPELSRANTIRVGTATRAPPPSYARSSSAVGTVTNGNKSSGTAGDRHEDGQKYVNRDSYSPNRVHKNPFGAMLL